MRTTIRIDDHLLHEAKKMAMATNTTLSALVETAVKEMLSKRQKKTHRKPFALLTYKGHGLKYGVDLDDSAALLDLMEKK
ncbi:MAG: type II toxin-antitoxin system VapB family antitoxin [Thermodesulfobacteriota bacterium]